MEKIKVYELKRTDLRDATVIEGFPSVGLVSTICANYLISYLGLEQIGIIDSIYFPAVSVVRDNEPLNPVRIYGGKVKDKEGEIKPIVVFVSEFQPPPKIIKIIAGTILDWLVDQKCGILISPEGLVIESDNYLKKNLKKGPFGDDDNSGEEMIGDSGTGDNVNMTIDPGSGGAKFDMDIMDLGDIKEALKGTSDEIDEEEKDGLGEEGKNDIREESSGKEKKGQNSGPLPDKNVGVWGIASTKEAREILEKSNVSPFTDGIIQGVAGVLINEGKRRGFSVIGLLTEAHQEIPDARAAAKIIQSIDNLILNLGLNVEPLFQEAELIEKKIMMLRSQMEASKKIKSSEPASGMYS